MTWAMLMLVVLMLWLFLRGLGIKKLFGVPFYYVLLGADIGGYKKPYYLKSKGISGAPDAVFINPFILRLFVGEFKSRSYSGKVTVRERYQVILYAGMAQSIFLPKVKAVIAYGSGQVIDLPFNKSTYKALLGLRKEYKESSKKGYPIDTRGLWQR